MFCISAANASVLPPAPAQRSSTCFRGPAPDKSAAICEPSSWISNHPAWKAASACRFGVRCAPDGGGTRMPMGEIGHGAAPNGSSAFRTFSCVDFRVLTRRSAGARRAIASPSATALPPNCAENDGQSHSGMSARAASGASAMSRVRPARSASDKGGGECSAPSQAAMTASAEIPSACGAAPIASARGPSSPSAQASEARRRRAS